jgi:hypothetical protein
MRALLIALAIMGLTPAGALAHGHHHHHHRHHHHLVRKADEETLTCAEAGDGSEVCVTPAEVAEAELLPDGGPE